jgi:hypothetical protein
MINELKSEFRKLLTIRSTYFVSGFVLLVVAFFSVYVFGYKQAAGIPTNADFMAQVIYSMLGTFAIFATVTSILIVAHEYRYNTILFSLTATRSRLRVLAAKVIVALSYATIVGAATVALTYFGTRLGLAIDHVTLVAQNLNLGILLPQWLAYIWGYALVGVILAVIIRGLVGSIVAFFLIPTIENILSLILKGNTKFLPFRALDSIAATAIGAVPGSPNLSHMSAFLVTLVYLTVFGFLAILLFTKRDAS